MRTGVVLLAGGKSRRMGRDKAKLPIDGKSFLERIAHEIEGFSERLLSIDDMCSMQLSGYTTVHDIYPGNGPIGGLHAALTCCRSDALLVVTCDVPLFQCRLGEYLVQFLTSDYDGVVAVTRDGRIHPFCGVYRKEMAELLEAQIFAEKLSMMDAIKKMRLYHADLTDTPYSDNCLMNINTPDEYDILMKTVLGGLCAANANTKKTTLPK